jgi:hypothetical protein
MANEFVVKNGLISQGNITATGSLVVSQNISASNISASGTISASVFSGAHTGSTFGTSSWSTNALTASYVSSSNIVGTVTSASYAVSSSFSTTAGALVTTNNYTVNNLTANATGSFGMVGVGTSSPLGKIDIRPDPVYPGAGAVIVDTDGGNNPRIRMYRPDGGSSTSSYAIHIRNDSGNLNILTAGTNATLGSETVASKFYFTSTGQLGIGTTSPNTLLNVGSGTPSTAANGIQFGSDTSANLYRISTGVIKTDGGLTAAGNITIAKNGAYLYLNGTNGDAEILWQANSVNKWAVGMNVGDPTQNFNIYNYTTATTNLTILSASGNVGIGSAAPTVKLDVVGSAAITSTGAVPLALYSNTHPLYCYDTVSGVVLARIVNTSPNTGSGAQFLLRSGSTDSLVLNSNGTSYLNGGNVGIGTASPSALLHVSDSTSEQIRVQSTGTPTRIRFVNNAGTSYTSYIGAETLGASNVGLIFQTGTGGATRMVVDVNGNVGIGTTNPVNKLDVAGNISCSVITASNFFGTSSWASNALTTSNVNGGTNTYLARWTGNTSLSTGLIRDNGTDLGIGTTPTSVYGIYHTRTSIETTAEIAGYNLTITNPNTGSTVLQTFRATSLYNAPTGSTIAGICSDFLSYTQVNSSGSLYAKIWQFYAGGFVLTGSVTDKTSFYAANAATGAGATVTTEHGLYVSALTAGTTIYGIRSIVATSTNRWNLYIDGTAKNYIAGNVGIGTSTSVNKLDVVGNISCSVITASLFSGSLSGSVFGTSSWATNALTAAFLPVGTYSITSSWATNSLTASSLVIANNYQVATLSINTSSVLLPLTVHGTTYSASISGQAANSIFRIGGAGTNAILDMGVNADVAPGFSWLQARSKIDYSSFSNLSLNSVGGNVGVGTTTPTAILEVSSSTALTVFNVKGAGGTNLFTISGSGNIGVGTTPSTTYKMQINGGFSATTKSFDIEHPTKLGKRLVYGSLESPYHGVRLTGKGKLVKGKGIIQLPDYMKSLVDYETVNVQITNIKHNKVIYVDNIDEKNNNVSVAAKIAKTQLNKELEFYWTFTAIRKDVPNLQVEL